MMSSKAKIGDIGERAVSRYLRFRFYKIIARNYNCRWGELDIVAKRGKCLCFIEVKTRGEGSFGRPADAVDRVKQAKIIKSAYYFLKKNQYYSEFMRRFDVAEVYINDNKVKINYIQNAFEQNEENYFK